MRQAVAAVKGACAFERGGEGRAVARPHARTGQVFGVLEARQDGGMAGSAETVAAANRPLVGRPPLSQA